MIQVTPKQDCRFCRGSGELYDFVSMPSGSGYTKVSCGLCDCVIEQLTEAQLDSDEEVELVLSGTEVQSVEQLK